MLYIGCYIFIFTLLLYILSAKLNEQFDDFATKILCNLTWAWLLPISLTLSFGTVAVRTWRIYRLFTNPFHPGRFIGDYYLIAFVFILLLVDIFVAIVWMAIDPQGVEQTSYKVTEGVVMFQVVARVCISQNSFWIF